MEKIKLTIKDLISLVKWKDVKCAIKYHYPADKNNYENLFYKLAKMPKVIAKPNEYMHIYGGISHYYLEDKKRFDKFIKDIKEELDDTMYQIVILKSNYEECKNWSMSFVSWKKLASMPISHDTLTHYSFEDIVAHFIWEITFYGDEKQSEKHKKEIFRRVKEVKKSINK